MCQIYRLNSVTEANWAQFELQPLKFGDLLAIFVQIRAKKMATLSPHACYTYEPVVCVSSVHAEQTKPPWCEENLWR